MAVSAKTILDFHRKRTQAHIDCLNYFAGLLGYHFPEHDNDKNSGTIQNGYAYINYANYHPECHLTEAHRDLYEHAHSEHHRTQPHHIEHYPDVCNLPDLTIIEMVCDWHSANFEQIFILHQIPPTSSVQLFFDTNLRSRSNLHWTDHQIALITELTSFLDLYTDFDAVMAIWRPLLAL